MSKTEQSTKHSRSKIACVNCRKRKRKCEGKIPCRSCIKRNEECRWEKYTKDKDYRMEIIPFKQSIIDGEYKQSDVGVSYKQSTDERVMYKQGNDEMVSYKQGEEIVPYKQINDEIVPYKQANDEIVPYKQINDEMVPYKSELEHLDEKLEIEEVNKFEPLSQDFDNSDYDSYRIFIPSPINFGDSISYLRDQDKTYVEYFETVVAKSLSLAPAASNHLVKTFACLSREEIGPINALAAWGKLFYNPNSQDKDFDLLMSKAVQAISDKFANKQTLSKRDYVILLNFSLILVGIYICSGDTFKWRVMLENAYNLLEDYGGIEKFAYELDSSDVRFLLSDFQYHDVMCSSACIKGTFYPISVYNNVFKTTSPTQIDTLQGTIKPLILIYGEIINAKVKILHQRHELIVTQYSYKDEELDQFFQIESEMLESISHMIDKLDNKIIDCTQVFPDDILEEEKVQHSQLFELYKLVCKTHLLLYVKRLPPTSVEVQSLFLPQYQLIQNLMQTNMVVVMCLPLITIAAICCNDVSRKAVRRSFDFATSRCPVNNLKKGLIIAQEIWKINPIGDGVADWSVICNDFGWELCVC